MTPLNIRFFSSQIAWFMTTLDSLLQRYFNVSLPVAGVVAVRKLGRDTISLHRATATTWNWHKSRNGQDLIAVLLLFDGAAHLSLTGVSDADENATGLIMHSNHQVSAEFEEGTVFAVAWVPTARANDLQASLDAGPRQLVANVISLGARGFLAGALSQAAKDSGSALATERLMEELVHALLLDAAAEIALGAIPRSRSLLDRAESLISRGFSNPHITASTIASELGISARHLQRVFHETHRSPAAVLRDTRAAAASALLAAQHPLTPSQIAAASGFRSSAAMRRALELTPA